MTHHVKNPAEDTGVAGNEKPRDYTEVEQNRNFLPNVEETATVKPEDTKEVGVKGKKKNKSAVLKQVIKDGKFNYSIESDDMRAAMKCAFCGNSLAQYKDEKGKNLPIGKHVLENKKLQKATGGKYINKSPGVAEGQVMAVLCPDCQGAKDAGQNVDFKTAVIISGDGRVVNIPVSEL